MAFATTQWSIILKARGVDSGEARSALEELCATYWPPLYTFLRRKGYSAEDARDLTQEFFTLMLERHFLARVDPEGGKFRTFLLTCLTRFLANEYEKRTAAKRNKGRPTISIDVASAEAMYGSELRHVVTPEKAFERQWALAIMRNAAEALRKEYEAAGNTGRYEALKAYITTGSERIPYAEIALQLGMTEGAVKVAVHRLRGTYRDHIREEVAQTVAGSEKIDEEIKHLLSALSY